MQNDDLWLTYGVTEGAIEAGLFAKLTSVQVVRVSPAGGVSRFEARDPAAGFAMHPNLTSDSTGTIHVLYHAGARDDDPGGTLRWTRLAPNAARFEASQAIDGPFTFNEQWGEPGFLGDYFGVGAADGSVMAAYGLGVGADVHVTFQKRPVAP
jgi:hypothetical protein